MGILDDAIREHLDLKRRQGAEAEEIQRLESEAFGPPARPGEPDFPQTGESEAVQDASGAAQPGASEQFAPDPAAEQAPEPAVEPQPPPEPEPAAEQTTPESGGFFDQGAFGDLGSDEPAAEPRVETGEQPLADGSPETSQEPQASEPPIESFDTVEHHFEEAIEETGEADALEAEVVDAEIVEEPPVEPAEESGEEEEDVLEETPEFLRDQPEDDELWFEQGEPKDFDF